MYERMLDKQTVPTIEEMAKYCGNTASLLASLNEWLSHEYETEQQLSFRAAD